MEPNLWIEKLRRNGSAIRELFRAAHPSQIRWRPNPDAWSLLEILNHLADEERDDFRQRLRLTLEEPGTPWPPIDPAGWVVERRYNEREPEASLEDFCAERERSLDWLQSLSEPDWQRAHRHPHLGRLRAGDLLASWNAHDLLHLAQMARTQLAFLEGSVDPFHIAYATGGPAPGDGSDS